MSRYYPRIFLRITTKNLSGQSAIFLTFEIIAYRTQISVTFWKDLHIEGGLG